MKTIPATIPAAAGFTLDRQKLASLAAGFASTSLFIGKIVLALPFFSLAVAIFALHLIFPSEEHW